MNLGIYAKFLVPTVIVILLLLTILYWPANNSSRVNCQDMDIVEISELWIASSDVGRRDFVNCIVNNSWNGSSLQRFDVENSMLAGMSKSQVELLLGGPDHQTDRVLWYSLGVKERNELSEHLSKGQPKPSRSFCISFDETTWIIESIYIEGQ